MRPFPRQLRAVFVYGVEDKTAHQVTDGLSDTWSIIRVYEFSCPHLYTAVVDPTFGAVRATSIGNDKDGGGGAGGGEDACRRGDGDPRDRLGATRDVDLRAREYQFAAIAAESYRLSVRFGGTECHGAEELVVQDGERMSVEEWLTDKDHTLCVLPMKGIASSRG